MSTVESEHVLVVPRKLLDDLGYFQGFQANTEGYLDALLEPEHASYLPRAEMEEDPSYKQLIPYVLFEYTGESGRQLFAYTRGGGQGEKRLHSKRSVGVGGHICREDQGQESHPYEEGLRRELAEEVDIRTTHRERCVGLINDDETEVGRVHLGVVHIFSLERPDVVAREEDLIETGFWDVEELLADLDRFETWSQICLRALYG